MNIVVIGNSHAAAIMQGWNASHKEYPNLNLRFFASRGMGLSGLELNGHKLVASNEKLKHDLAFTSGGYDHIDFDSFDIILLVGLNWGFSDYPNSNFSSAVRRATIRGRFEESLCGSVFSKTRSATNKPIFVLHKPLPRRNPDASSDFGLPYGIRFSEAVDALSGIECILVRQPSVTITNDRFTKDIYASGALQLDVGKGANEKGPADYSHMNTLFGVESLKALFLRVKSI